VRTLATLLASLLVLVGGAPEPSRYEWSGIERVVAIGDVHGSHDELARLLRSVGLVDAALAWAGGEDHLVFCGDLIDRGPDDRRVLDLVMRLQDEAAAAGGRVHVLLGNHEVMNLSRDLRYVHPKGFADFAGDERAEDREAAWRGFRASAAAVTNGLSRKAFDHRYPPGYFARERAFSRDGRYGAWLLEQPAVIEIDGTLFVHGGLTESVAKLGLEGINRGVRAGIVDFMDAVEVLEKEVGGPAGYAELHAAATRLAGGNAGRGKRVNREVAAARMLLDLAGSPAFDPAGPLWYRGNSLENERILRVPMAGALEALGAKRLVVAHTPTDSGRITQRFAGRLIRADVGLAYGGTAAALILRGDATEVFDPETFAVSRPLAEPPQGEGWPTGHGELPDPQLERFLARAKVTSFTDEVRGDREFALLELADRQMRLRGVLQYLEERPAKDAPPGSYNPRRYQHEVAAFRLDRMLGLHLVPVVVPRTIDKRRGALSVWLETAIDLKFIRDRGRLDLLGGLEPQIAKARVFTALIGNRTRHDAAKMLIPPERKIMIGDNSKGFPLNPEIADMVEIEIAGLTFNLCNGLDAHLDHALRSLDRKRLDKELGPFLSDAQIDALLIRRDRILATCAGSGLES
jgi:hypothetical protein